MGGWTYKMRWLSISPHSLHIRVGSHCGDVRRRREHGRVLDYLCNYLLGSQTILGGTLSKCDIHPGYVSDLERREPGVAPITDEELLRTAGDERDGRVESDPDRLMAPRSIERLPRHANVARSFLGVGPV